ncbi:hypothetical protein EV699_11289 [Plasticicumulans lactativorans]|uniref:Lipoprotein n=1 Tax=Plasticicumulans lactativorans TaxID=1133106 RepID=A0A4R2L313_9GAMM|nr:hypothetical protein [Plasticicumulans lactativorans]TCO80753.1 hypothetical protein EV699_11289 [Plasticicumulans lactativorans]
MHRTVAVGLGGALGVLLGLAGCTAPGPGAGRPSLHTLPLASRISGSFALGERRVYLPPGDWRLLASRETTLTFIADALEPGPSLGAVYVGEFTAGRLSRGVKAVASLYGEPGIQWNDEPCRGDDGLFKLDRRRSFRNQSCLEIRSRAPALTELSGPRAPAAVLAVTFTRYDTTALLVARYEFNPEAFGFPDAAGAAWTPGQVRRDPRKAAFVEALTAWATAALPWFEYGYDGAAVPTTPFPPPPRPGRAPAAAGA